MKKILEARNEKNTRSKKYKENQKQEIKGKLESRKKGSGILYHDNARADT